MPLINCFKNPDKADNTPSPRSYTAAKISITIGGQPIPVTRSRRDEMAMRINAAVEAHRIAMRAERQHGPPPGGWTGWVTSEGHGADFPRVELVPHHPSEHEDRTDLRQYRLAGLQDQLTALQRPLNAIANEASDLALDGVGEWSSGQADVLVRVSDLEEEVATLLEALRERF